MCNCDVPRNALGWPTVEPKYFTEAQLRKECEQWRTTALNTGRGTIGYSEWEKYAKELHRREFLSVVDPRIPVIEPISEERQLWIFGKRR